MAAIVRFVCRYYVSLTFLLDFAKPTIFVDTFKKMPILYLLKYQWKLGFDTVSP